ncbi:ERF family protein [Acinetobacter dispersus]|uniref:Essential recombination function protein n=1 Tax=Acinetobacter dispersus TaxID=70348 RepID=N9MHM2_9GAMM|nr:ERF family protein [Acinetobacter dispersus]ENW92790.1 hypothetical protein F904_02733 [Acinetobacter dispersus]
MSNSNIDALRVIQTELKAPKSKYNKFGKFHYRSLEDILEGVKPLLQKYGATLVVSDEVQQIGPVVVVTAKAVFTDDQGKQTVATAHAGVELDKKGMDVAQTFGASSSYARKYALNGLFLIDDTQDPDTDAFHEQNNGQGQNNRNQNQGNVRGQNNGNRNQQSGNSAQNTRAQSGNQNQQNPSNQTGQRRTIHQRYQDALPKINSATDPDVIFKALEHFKNTQYSAGITNACRAKSDQMGWNLNIPVSEIHNQYNQMHH